jgi:hypothetical protein
MSRQPTLLNSCAFAATAAEARFRINAKPQPDRQTRVVALDSGAGAIIRPLVGLPWRSSRFLRYDGARPIPMPRTDQIPAGAEVADLALVSVDGGQVQLSTELSGTDFVLMVATGNDGATAGATIGMACMLRGIMTAAVVLGGDHHADGAITALRPFARVLLVSHDPDDVAEVMSAVAS